MDRAVDEVPWLDLTTVQGTEVVSRFGTRDVADRSNRTPNQTDKGKVLADRLESEVADTRSINVTVHQRPSATRSRTTPTPKTVVMTA